MSPSIKIALRALYREKRYAAINIVGLALALACAIVLALYLRFELTYDRHHVLHDRIYRVVNEFTIGGKPESFALTSAVLGPLLAEEYPDVQAYVRFRPTGNNSPVLIRAGDDARYWNRVYFATDNVFEVFTHEILEGDPGTALDDPSSVAVSETFARRYFGDESALGRIVTTDANRPLTITLVFADLPENSHLKYDVLLSMNAEFMRTPEDTSTRRAALFGVQDYTYLVMPERYDVRAFDAISADLFERHMASIAAAANASWRAWLQPLPDIHLGSDVGYDQPTGNRYYLYGFAAVGVLILLIAAINYVNLSTARAAKRARNVGIRKILGSDRASLMLQFLGEAVLFSVLAGVAAVVLVEAVLALTPLEELIGRRLSLDVLDEPWQLAAILGVSAVFGLLAGAYPAVYLSAYAPLTALVGRTRTGKRNARFRQVLVFIQFAMSIVVIASTLLMAAQIRYLSERDLGFDEENRVIVTLRGVDLLERAPALIEELKSDSRVLGVTTSATIMGRNLPISALGIENNTGVIDAITISHMPVGRDFLQVMGMKLTAGRDFSQRLLTDVGATAIVNEALVRTMGWDEPLGKRLQLPNGTGGITAGRVIGVVADFNFKSLHTEIEPLVMYPLVDDYSSVDELQRPFVTRLLIVNFARESLADGLRMLQAKLAAADPRRPFEFEFLDDSLRALYDSERKLAVLLGVFAAICILIACLGLFGLASFTTEQRTKELGVRKVLGATPMQLLWLLSRTMLLMIVGASVVASLVAYIAVDEWLRGFAYRAPIDPLVFGEAALAATLVAFVTLALQSHRSVREDPVEALRHE